MVVESDTCYALGDDGTTWHWGLGVNDANGRFADMTRASRRLGAALSGSPFHEPEVDPVLRPTVLPGLPALKSLEVTMIAGFNDRYSSGVRGISLEGDLWEFGGAYRKELTKVEGLRDVVATAGDKSSHYAIQADGTLWGWGEGKDVPLGDGTEEYRESPVLIPVPGRVISGTVSHMRFALCADGSIWAWGWGQLGIGSYSTELSPVRVPGIQDAVSIATVGSSAFVVRRNGSLLSWGSNEDGQLGDGTTADRARPASITGIPKVVDLKFSEATVPNDGFLRYRQATSAYAVTDRGQLWSWGNNKRGRLGVGQTVNSLTPRLVDTIRERVVRVIAAGEATYAVTAPSSERGGRFSRRRRP